jgi:ribose 5-phosphate isomerase B
MRIAIAADHNGVALKAQLASWLAGEGHQVDDRGTGSGEAAVDYPPLCDDLCREVTSGRADRGIVVGGAGGGELIACNKLPGIRAALGYSEFTTGISRANNDSNVLVLGAKVTAPALAEAITRAWLVTPFQGGRHRQRLDMIAALERGERLRPG